MKTIEQIKDEALRLIVKYNNMQDIKGEASKLIENLHKLSVAFPEGSKAYYLEPGGKVVKVEVTSVSFKESILEPTYYIFETTGRRIGNIQGEELFHTLEELQEHYKKILGL